MMSQPTFTDTLINFFAEISERKIFSKGDYILKEGQVEKNLYLVETGAIRVFYVSEFEEQTIRFGYQGSFINSLSSFIKGTPSEFYIEAIRKTTIKIISKGDLLKLVSD